MAPGVKEKHQTKRKLSTSQPDPRQNASKKATPNFVTLSGIKEFLGKTNMTSNGESSCTRNETLGQNISSKRCATTTTRLSPEREDTGSLQSHESAVNCSPHITSPETHVEEAPRSKRRGRGQTMGKGIMKAFEASKTKMKIIVDPSIGRPKDGDQSAKLSSQIGVVTRDVIPVPRRWKEVDKENGLGPGLDHIQMHMDVNVGDPGVKESLIERLKNSTRQKRYKLHKHYQKYQTMELAKRNKPLFCLNQENWESLCEHFASPQFKKSSATNSENRKLVRAPHISGRTPFTVRRQEISEQELNGDTCDRIELYKRTHFSEKNGWSSEVAEENWELMKKKQEQYKEEGCDKSTDDIVLEVLGHGAGYIKGLGYGPKPVSRCNNSANSYATQQLQKQLQESQQRLEMSESQVGGLNAKVVDTEKEVLDLRNQLAVQASNMEKIMAFMAVQGMSL